MRTLGNVLWFITGGFIMGVCWYVAGILAFLSILGIPWARSCFVIGEFSFFPFGQTAISRRDLYQEEDLGTGLLGAAGNLIWLFLFGIWLALGHLLAAGFNFITIIGIPFGIQHLKLANISLAPIGMTIVPNEVAQAARSQQAQAKLKLYRMQ